METERRYQEHFFNLAIEDRLKRLIVDCLNEPDRTEELTRILAELVEIAPVAHVLLPLIGIDLRLDEYAFADDVWMITMNPERFESIVVHGYIAELKRAMPVHGDPVKLAHAFADSLQKSFQSGPVLIVTAAGDEHYAA